MTKVIYGSRIGQTAVVRVECSAVIFDLDRQYILLTQRTDNGKWCLPGGTSKPGETVEETCIREVYTETGLEVQVTKLIGIYSSPDFIIQYVDGNRFKSVALSFEVLVLEGRLGLSNETIKYGYFSPREIGEMDVMEHHRQRITHALANQLRPFIR